MGMRKFLCAIIGLLFAVPSFANCNLFETVDTTSSYNDVTLTSAANGLVTVVGTATGNGGRNTAILQNFTLPAGTYTVSFSGTKRSQLYLVAGNDSTAPNLVTDVNGGTFTISESTTLHFGLNLNIGTTYNDSFYIQVEAGSTATAYTPYNPLCATCDGTVVNYTSATGTVTQNGTPTPTNPITPVFYTQGNMVLRRVGDYADSYDATTGKITRKVGVLVLTGNETWTKFSDSNPNNIGTFYTSLSPNGIDINGAPGLSTHFPVGASGANGVIRQELLLTKAVVYVRTNKSEISDETQLNQWLAEQYAAGTPVVVYYQLAEAVEETVPASYCQQNIRVATTKYVETEFSALNTALANAVATVNTVVTQTIAQAASIATLQSGKQTRPADNAECPAYKQCLLVEDENGTPHWYEITDPFRDFVAPIIANNVGPASTTNQPGYTQLEYIESTGRSYIDTDIQITSNTKMSLTFKALDGTQGKYLFGEYTSNDGSFYVWGSGGYFQFAYGCSYVTSSKAWDTEKHTANFYIQNGRSIAEVDNRIVMDQGVLERMPASNIIIAGTNQATMVASQTYSAKFYNNGTLVRNLVPAKRNSDSAVGLYDTVTKTFFANAGTGAFTAGPVVANTDVPANPTWTATWAADATTGVSAGTVYGEGLCNGVVSSQGSVATSEQLSASGWSQNGANCWCRATGVDDGNESSNVDGVWVFHDPRSSAADCAGGCAYYCAYYVRHGASFRSAVFGM